MVAALISVRVCSPGPFGCAGGSAPPGCGAAGGRLPWPAGAWPAVQPALPAGAVPVPAHVQAGGQGRPRDEVRGPGWDLLVAAGTAIGLAGRGPGHQADHPVPVRPRLGVLGTGREVDPAAGQPLDLRAAAG